MKIVSNKAFTEDNETRCKFFQYFAAISATLGVVSTSMHYGWSSPSSPQLRSGKYFFSISSQEESWLTVTPLLGAILGALVAGFIADIFGRKNLIVISAVPLMISWIFVAIAKSSLLMFVGRFMAGVCDGASYTIVPMYLVEIAEPKIRVVVTSMLPSSFIFGILMINIIGSFEPIDTTAYISIIFPAMLLPVFSQMPESPYFLLMKGRTEEAKKSLQIFRGTSDVSEELERMATAVEEQNNQDKGKFIDLFSDKTNRRSFLMATGLTAFQQLSGTTAVVFYCQTIFMESKDILSPNIATIIYFSIQLVLSFLSSVIAYYFAGRRLLLVVSNIGTTFCLFANGCYLYLKNCTDIDTSSFSSLPIVALLCYVIAFSIGWQTIPLLITGEIFPINVKGFALSLLDVSFSVMVTIISKFFHWSNDKYGLYVPFLTFGGFCVLAFIFIIVFVPETKNKTLEDIQEELIGGEFGWYKKNYAIPLTNNKILKRNSSQILPHATFNFEVTKF